VGKIQDRYLKRDVPFDLFSIDVLGASDKELEAMSQDLGLAMSVDEMHRVRDYFKAKGRNPTDVELQALGQAWSEHCCYKSSKVFLKEFIFPVQTADVIDRGDAGVMAFDDDHAYAIRIESHNHPSAVEPYGGAATGIGGIIRDVLAMGAQPIALTDPLHFGQPSFAYDKLPRGLKHPKYLFNGVVAGIRDYGNRVGLPTVSGCVIFDEGYVGNIIVNVGCVGFAKRSKLLKNRVKSSQDVLILVGGKTGRDGIHGVTFASVDLTEKAVEEWHGGAVQLGDPITKEPLIHACMEAAEKGLLSGLKDLGGGGLSCVVGEIALNGGCGAEVDLDKVPLKAAKLAPWEIWVSESQERMMLAVHPDNVQKVLAIFDLYDVMAAVIGRATDDKIARVKYQGVTVLEMDLDFYTGGPEYARPYSSDVPRIKPEESPPIEPTNYPETLSRLLSSLDIADKELVIRQYDHEVRAATVIKPMQGKIGKSSHGDAAVIRPLIDSYRALAITTASTPFFTAINPFRGGASAVDEMVRNLVAVGAKPHSLTNCLNFGNPEKPDRLGYFRETVRGIGLVAQAMGIAIPSGNVSFYNESALGMVPPTPVVLGVGIVEDFRKCITTDLKIEGDMLYIIGETQPELGGSEYYRLMGASSPEVPDINTTLLKASADGLLAAIGDGCLAACHDLSGGGLVVAAAEMCMGGDVGARLDLKGMDSMRLDFQLFSESNGRWLVEVRREKEERFLGHLQGVSVTHIGSVGGTELSIVGEKKRFKIPVNEMREAWTAPLYDQLGGMR
jgi:phosphoribosylformylglycinamidine synthase II